MVIYYHSYRGYGDRTVWWRFSDPDREPHKIFIGDWEDVTDVPTRIGFPDTFQIDPTKSHAYEQFGNSVTVNVLIAIIEKIYEVI